MGCSTVIRPRVYAWIRSACTLFLAIGFLSGCVKPIEERTAREKKVMSAHRQRINLAKEQKDDPNWKQAYEEIASGPREAVLRPNAAEPLPKLVRGPHDQKSLLLTFDDGPHPAYTPKLLKLLTEESVPATFFVIGKMAEKHPELVRDIVRSGNTIGNHTFSHVTLTRIPAEDIRTEYRANNELIKRLTGVKMTFCRPPGGDYDPTVIRAAQEEGLTTVLWTDDPGDFANPGEAIVLDRTLKKLRNGGVVLLHDGSPNTVNILRELIHEARERGFTFVSPQQMVDGLCAPRRTSTLARRPEAANVSEARLLREERDARSPAPGFGD